MTQAVLLIYCYVGCIRIVVTQRGHAYRQEIVLIRVTKQRIACERGQFRKRQQNGRIVDVYAKFKLPVFRHFFIFFFLYVGLVPLRGEIINYHIVAMEKSLSPYF